MTLAPTPDNGNSPIKHSTAAYVTQHVREVFFFVCLVIAIYFFISLLSYRANDAAFTHTGDAASLIRNWGGPSGAWFADISLSLLGYFAYLTPLITVLLGWLALRKFGENFDEFSGVLWFFRLAGFFIVLFTGCALVQLVLSQIAPQFSVHLPQGSGGILGQMTADTFFSAFNLVGSVLFLSAIFLIGITLLTGVSWVKFSILTGTLTGAGMAYLSKGIMPGLLKLKTFFIQSMAAVRIPKSLQADALSSEEGSAIELNDNNDHDESQNVEKDVEPIKKTEVPQRYVRKQPTLSRIAPTIKNNLNANSNPASNPPSPEAVPSMPIVQASPPLSPIKPIYPSLPKRTDNAAFSQTNPTRTNSAPSTPVRANHAKTSSDVDNNTGFPGLDLLDEPTTNFSAPSKEALEALSRTLELKLADFKIKAEVVGVLPGPVVTRFEIMPAPGIKVSQITGLAKDLARSLTALSVRVVEVIPGKSVIGIEIPNEHRDSVSLSEIIGSEIYLQAKSPLTLALGKDIAGIPTVMDLAKMPHMLVAGTTGSGKSVAINVMIISLLYRAKPEEVRMIMIDPKMLELSIYEGIPHLLAPVVTDMKKAFNALNWCVQEMERRYKTMAHVGVRNLMGFNKKVNAAIQAGEPLANPLYTPPTEGQEEDNDEETHLAPYPYIVVIVDELADMMMIVGKKVEQSIARLAQKARAAGIHLILATQRPSVDVLTGLIKSNIPARIAFQVSSKIDSRTVLDQMGAESLLGLGDMLFLPPGTSVPQRVHGAFVDDHEVHNIVEELKSMGAPQYIDAILNGSDMDDEGGIDGLDDDAEKDALYDEAVSFVTESRKASISAVQRRLKVGYNRAARMIEQMELTGVVSDIGNNGMREVLAPPPPRD